METYITMESELHKEAIPNTHETVILKLVSLWQDFPEESNKLFHDIAVRIAQYDNPKFPTIYHEPKRDRYMAIKHFTGGTKTIAQGKTYHLCEERLANWLRFNR